MSTRPEPLTDLTEIHRLIAEHGRWWHEIEVALDIGCSDGYFSFEMERRGASVVALDFVPEHYSGFATARKILGSAVEYRMDNVYNLKRESYGEFDVVLFMGVLYHLRKPLAALDTVRSVTKAGGQLFVGTMMIDDYFQLPDGSVTTLAAVSPLLLDVPLWQQYPSDSLNGDFTNCFAPNRRALEVSLAEAQFRVEAFQMMTMGGYARAVATVDAKSFRTVAL